MDLKAITLSIDQIAEEKGIPEERVRETLEQAIAAAYKKEYGTKGQRIEAKIDQKSGDMSFWQVKEVVTDDMIYSEEELEEMRAKSEDGELPEEIDDPSADGAAEETDEPKKVRFSDDKHIMLDEAQKLDKKAEAGGEVTIPLEEREDFGRIATQTAKQVIVQKLREAEREAILDEFESKEGEIISGIVQRAEEDGVHIDLGRTVAYMPRSEQVPGEFYRPGQRLKFYVLEVEQTSRGPRIVLSRAYPKLVSKLFELEVPEIASEQIEVKAIAREPGSRSKIAVATEEEGLDPVGSCIGQRGSRVGAVITELGGEKVDIIEYSDNQEEYIRHALSPAQVTDVELDSKNTAVCVVPDDQLSLAIGRDGQNVRLAAKLTGWKIDVKGAEGGTDEGEPQDEGHADETKEASEAAATQDEATEENEDPPNPPAGGGGDDK